MGFSILETMRLEGGHVVRGERHLARAAAKAHPAGAWRTRLLIASDGLATVECARLAHDATRIWRVALAAEPVASNDPSLRVKTTRRGVYDRAKAARPDVDDVLLWNERDELTESTIANVVVEIDNGWYTPPLSCGLLPGIFRAAVLDADMVRERVVTKDDLRRATRLWLINSLREWMRARLEP